MEDLLRFVVVYGAVAQGVSAVLGVMLQSALEYFGVVKIELQ